jgi:hypothetical protein
MMLDSFVSAGGIIDKMLLNNAADPVSDLQVIAETFIFSMDFICFALR